MRAYRVITFRLRQVMVGSRWEADNPFKEGEKIILANDATIGDFLRTNAEMEPGKRLKIVFDPFTKEEREEFEKNSRKALDILPAA
jgi:hypothetical protein